MEVGPVRMRRLPCVIRRDDAIDPLGLDVDVNHGDVHLASALIAVPRPAVMARSEAARASPGQGSRSISFYPELPMCPPRWGSKLPGGGPIRGDRGRPVCRVVGHEVTDLDRAQFAFHRAAGLGDEIENPLG